MEGGWDERPSPKSVLYVAVLNTLMLRGRVEQLASAVPQKLTGGSRGQRQLLADPNKGLISNAQYVHEHPRPSVCCWRTFETYIFMFLY